MKKIISTILSICMLLLVTACNKFLDINPDDKLTQEQVEVSESSINYVLNGIYMNMSNNYLYGSYLTMTITECLAQRYNLSDSRHPFYNYGRYDYAQSNVQSSFSSIWEQAYVQILGINKFIDLVNNTTVNIPANRKNILLGEAYALRAFHHFDLLRIFGPIYNTSDSTSISIPYYVVGNGELMPLLPTNEVMGKILADLKNAETLLQNDPIVADGVVTESTNDPIKDFYINRNYRMNYYAVKAMQARVWLWRENKPAALEAAKAVIEASLIQSEELFPWLPYQDIIRGTNPDRVFSTEVIFGIQNRNMYNNQNSYFSASLMETNLLCPRAPRLTAAYESNENDYRYPNIWIIPASSGKGYRTFFKYERPNDFTAVKFGYFQPLIRISEMYYIAAECEPVPADGLTHLNQVRTHRNLSNLTNASTLIAEIQKEYVKEFYGEGQLFFYYKRNYNRAGTAASRQIPNGNADSGNTTMDAAKYQVPLPLSETNAR